MVWDGTHYPASSQLCPGVSTWSAYRLIAHRYQSTPCHYYLGCLITISLYSSAGKPHGYYNAPNGAFDAAYKVPCHGPRLTWQNPFYTEGLDVTRLPPPCLQTIRCKRRRHPLHLLGHIWVDRRVSFGMTGRRIPHTIRRYRECHRRCRSHSRHR